MRLRLSVLIGWFVLAGIALVAIPAYSEYCESQNADQQYCTAYKIALALGAFVENHNGAITALASVIITFFTWTLWRSGEKMWRATNRSIALARDEFVAAHPPIIRITQIDIDVTGWAAGQLPSGRLFITNGGDNDARIGGDSTHVNIVFFVGPNPPRSRPFDTAHFANALQVEDGILRAGQSKWWEIEDFFMVTPVDVERAIKPGSVEKLFIIGRVHFMDTRGVRGTTVFCRAYDPTTGRFVATNDPDYEYSK